MHCIRVFSFVVVDVSILWLNRDAVQAKLSDSNGRRIDVDQTLIRRESVGSMSDLRRAEGLCYLGLGIISYVRSFMIK